MVDNTYRYIITIVRLQQRNRGHRVATGFDIMAHPLCSTVFLQWYNREKIELYKYDHHDSCIVVKLAPWNG